MMGSHAQTRSRAKCKHDGHKVKALHVAVLPAAADAAEVREQFLSISANEHNNCATWLTCSACRGAFCYACP
eukprot:6127537-Amphidinium_carterae.1